MIRNINAFQSKEFDLVIIGAGILGASLAFHLTLRGVEVTVLEADTPGQGASRVSFAWINARDKNPRHYHDLNRRSLDMWDRFARRLGGDVGLNWGGELRWAATSDEAASMIARVKRLQSWGYPIRLVEPAAMRTMEPGLATGPVAAASFTEVDGLLRLGGPVVPEANQQVGANSDQFPADVHHQVVVAQHKNQHRGDEKVEKGEETGKVPIGVEVTGPIFMYHIFGGIHVDQEPDAGYHQYH